MILPSAPHAVAWLRWRWIDRWKHYRSTRALIRQARRSFANDDLIYLALIHKHEFCTYCHDYMAYRENEGRNYW